jgi:DNA-binding XRE family transcriptional regulator
LRVVRISRGLRQADAAALADVNRGHLSELENGYYRPRRATAERLADALRWPLDELFPNNDTRPADEPGAVKESAGTGRHAEP